LNVKIIISSVLFMRKAEFVCYYYIENYFCEEDE
jgi:hypothetical protein